MSDEHLTPPEVADAADQIGDATRGRSHADLIRERRARRQQQGPPEKALMLPEGEIVVVYNRATMKAVRAAANSKGALASNVRLLVDACKRIELRDPETGEQWPAAQDTDRPDDPVRFDPRLADLLGLDGKDPASILLQAFEGNDRAVTSHAMRLDRWSSGEDLDAEDLQEDDELLGGASAAT